MNISSMKSQHSHPKRHCQADAGQLHGFVLGRLATLAAWHALLGLPTPHAAPAVAERQGGNAGESPGFGRKDAKVCW